MQNTAADQHFHQEMLCIVDSFFGLALPPLSLNPHGFSENQLPSVSVHATSPIQISLARAIGSSFDLGFKCWLNRCLDTHARDPPRQLIEEEQHWDNLKYCSPPERSTGTKTCLTWTCSCECDMCDNLNLCCFDADTAPIHSVVTLTGQTLKLELLEIIDIQDISTGPCKARHFEFPPYLAEMIHDFFSFGKTWLHPSCSQQQSQSVASKPRSTIHH